jgi:hypothetical protein
MKYAIYFSKTLRGKNTLLGFRNDLYEAIEFGANAPGAGYFSIEEVETGKMIDLNNL